jgi:hypothetical protein
LRSRIVVAKYSAVSEGNDLARFLLAFALVAALGATTVGYSIAVDHLGSLFLIAP